MVPSNPESPSSDLLVDAASGLPPKALAPITGQGRLVGIVLIAGLLAGVAAWLAAEAILESYRDILSPKIRREVDAETSRRFARAHLTSASAMFTALGAIVGLSLGLTGGLARRSVSAAAKAALLGCVAGSIAAVAVSLVALPNFFKNHDPQSQDLVLPLLTVGSICSSIGAAGGLAFGFGLGGRDRWIKSLVGGLVGAALATVVYELVGAVAFATDKTELPVSHAYTTRAMLHILVAVFTAVGSALALSLSSRKRTPSS